MQAVEKVWCDWTTARCADGPQLASAIDASLRERGAPAIAYGESFDRCLRRWRDGETADFFTADKWLTHIGLHPMQVPDHVWRPWPCREHKARSRRCWNCGGSGLRCCEFGAER